MSPQPQSPSRLLAEHHARGSAFTLVLGVTFSATAAGTRNGIASEDTNCKSTINTAWPEIQ
jgi:hypothetical protein